MFQMKTQHKNQHCKGELCACFVKDAKAFPSSRKQKMPHDPVTISFSLIQIHFACSSGNFTFAN